MKKRRDILEQFPSQGEITGTEMAKRLGISRQAISKKLKELVRLGRVIKQGEARGARYRLAKPGEKPPTGFSVSRTYRLRGLEEDRVFDDLDACLSLKKSLSSSAYDIAVYAFTEMLNNAIDHSKSEQCRIELHLNSNDLLCRIRDRGIGVFYSISKQFDLPDEEAAVGELLKGKATTLAERHSGEGIFFTSKAVDRLSLRSHDIELVLDSKTDDIRLNRLRNQRGTDVRFQISRRSRRPLTRLFERFAPEEFDYRFEKTRIRVGVTIRDCISRSQAKRLVARLGTFRAVELDFEKVRTLGQGFCDDVFRVFLRAHPDIRITVTHLAPELHPLLLHNVDKQTSSQLTIG